MGGAEGLDAGKLVSFVLNCSGTQMSKGHCNYRVIWSSEDGEYVGLCEAFPSLSWLADTEESALAGIRKTVETVLIDLRSTGKHL